MSTTMKERRVTELAERIDQKVAAWAAIGTYDRPLAPGEPCIGCGLPVIDTQPGDPDPDEKFEARHPDCRAGRWVMSGSTTVHCMRCCPPTPIPDAAIAKVAEIMRPGMRRLLEELEPA